MTATCTRCGADKANFDRVCSSCGHRPEREGLLVAWLLSDAYLSAVELSEAATRIRHGQPVQPSPAQLDRARMALGVHESADPGLSVRDQLLIAVSSSLFTALPGIVIWAWWRTLRPRSARRALLLSLPQGLLWTGVMFLGWAREVGLVAP